MIRDVSGWKERLAGKTYGKGEQQSIIPACPPRAIMAGRNNKQPMNNDGEKPWRVVYWLLREAKRIPQEARSYFINTIFRDCTEDPALIL